MDNATELVNFVRGVVGRFIVHHALLTVSTEAVGEELCFRIYGHTGDLSRMIGKRGGNFRALETLLKLAGARRGLRCRLLKFPLKGEGELDRYPSFTLNREWPKDDLVALAGEMAAACLKTRAATVEVKDLSPHESALIIHVEPSAKDAYLPRFTEAASAMVQAGGAKCGRVLLATVVADLQL